MVQYCVFVLTVVVGMVRVFSINRGIVDESLEECDEGEE